MDFPCSKGQDTMIPTNRLEKESSCVARIKQQTLWRHLTVTSLLQGRGGAMARNTKGGSQRLEAELEC